MNKKTLRIVVVAFLAAFIAATGFFRIPIPGITGGIVIQNAMCILTAVILGSFFGAAPTALFFAVGALGVPIFSGWTGGFSEIISINGGFRVGWVVGALTAGLISGKADVADTTKIDGKVYVRAASFVRIILAVFAGMLVLYVPEIFWVLAYRHGEMGAGGALKFFVTCYFAPFVLVDFIKSLFVIALAVILRPVVAQYFEE